MKWRRYALLMKDQPGNALKSVGLRREAKIQAAAPSALWSLVTELVTVTGTTPKQQSGTKLRPARCPFLFL
jgi:hypothetical protein